MFFKEPIPQPHKNVRPRVYLPNFWAVFIKNACIYNINFILLAWSKPVLSRKTYINVNKLFLTVNSKRIVVNRVDINNLSYYTLHGYE